MTDIPKSPNDLSTIFDQRRKDRDPQIAEMNEVEDAILHGTLPTDYEKLFTESDIKLQIRTLRAADDGLTKFLSEIPILPAVDILGKRESETARNKAELVEKITYGWYNGSAMRGGTEFDGITFQLATHQVRFSDACLLVQADRDRKLVYLEALDPRFLYVPTGWHPWSQVPLNGALLVQEMTLGEVKQRFCYYADGTEKSDAMMRLNNAYGSKWGYAGKADADDSQIIRVAAYRHRQAWYAACLGDRDIVLAESQDGDPFHPGVCGVMSFSQFGRGPLFTGQIGIEAGLMKVVWQQISNTERINKATTIGPPLVNNTLKVGGYNEVNMAAMQGRTFNPFRMAPDSPSNLTQVAGFLLQMAQQFNYNPEAAMGAGEANSGKALQQLLAGPRALVTNILFSPYKPAMPRVHDDCLEMELNLWPNDKKTAVGYKGRQRMEVEYTPSAALQDFKGHIKIEKVRSGGYNSFLEEVQKRDAGLSDTLSVLERDPDVDHAMEKYRRIQAEQTENFVKAAFEGLGAQDPLAGIRFSAELLRRQEEGKSRTEAIQEMLAEGLFEPPAPEPQIPEDALAALGGGAGGPEVAGAMPSLQAARGF